MNRASLSAQLASEANSPQSGDLNYAQLASIWGPVKPALTLQQALQQLNQADSRHELAMQPQNNTTLLHWLQTQFAALMSEHAELTGLAKGVCASLWHKQMVELIMPSLVALRFEYGMVPQQPLAEIGLDIQANGRINTITVREGALSSQDQHHLDAALAAQIVQFADSLLAVFAEQKVNKKRFWGNLSNALAQGFSRLSAKALEPFTQQDVRQMNRWLASVLPENACLVELKLAQHAANSLVYVRRDTCCLKYRLDKQRMCKTCNLFELDEQQAFYLNKLRAA